MAGKVAPDDLAVDLPELLEARVVFDAVQDVPGHAHHVLGAGAGLMQHGNDVAQGLRCLCDEVVGLELLLAVPADLATDEYLRASGGNTVGITLGGKPSGRLKEFHGCLSLKR
jgi:hypothetical protein